MSHRNTSEDFTGLKNAQHLSSHATHGNMQTASNRGEIMISKNRERLDIDVAIIGGGFAGVYCGKALMKALSSNDQTRVAIISDENYMVFQPMLAEVAGSSIQPLHVINPIRSLVKGASIFRGQVSDINYSNRSLTLRPGPYSMPLTVRFKHLVLAVGATVDLSRVPGMPEHAMPMQNVGDAIRLRASVVERVEEANLVSDPKIKKQLLTVVVVGGGYSGVETAGELLDLMEDIAHGYKHIDREDIRVVLIHSRDVLLPTLSEKLGRYAERKLRDRGLEIILNRRVKSQTATNVTLDNGDTISCSTVVSTVGNAPHPLIKQLCQDTPAESVKGRLKVNEHFQVEGLDNVWAAGDCAQVPMKGGGTCPATAQFAMREGLLMGKNLAASMHGKPLAPFTFTGLGELAAIGHHTAVGNIMGVNFSGFIAWWMWRTVYLAKLPGVERKLRVMIDWTLDLFFRRDVTLLSPRRTKVLQHYHLEKGDILFKAGEPAFSFYIVKRGHIDIMDGERVIKSATEGEFFGERALLADSTWLYTAIAAEASTLVSLGAEEFSAVMETSTEFRKLLEQSAKQYVPTEDLDKLKDTLAQEICNKPVSDLMESDVFTLEQTSTVEHTLRLFKESRHSLYPIIKGEKRELCGVLRRDDFYDYIKQSNVGSQSTLEGLALETLGTLKPQNDISQAIDKFVREGCNKLLVVNDEGSLQGILSIVDIIEAAHAIPGKNDL